MMKESKGDNNVLMQLTERLDKLISLIEKEDDPDRLQKISSIINRLVKGE